MTEKMLYTYHEATKILMYPSYSALKMAVRRGKIKTYKRPGDVRSSFIHKDEIFRLLGIRGDRRQIHAVA